MSKPAPKMETRFLTYDIYHLLNPAAKCLTQIRTGPVMGWQPAATLTLLAIPVTNGSNPGDVLCDKELHVTWRQLKFKQENQFPKETACK